MKVDVCAICGAESAVADPESEPPYAHLSCVLKAGAQPQYLKNLRLYLTSQGPDPRRRNDLRALTSKSSDKTNNNRLTVRERLHPAVFETYYRPITLAQEPPLRSQSTTAPAPPALRKVGT